MSNPVTITIGVVTTAVKSGLAALRSQFSSMRSFANGELAGALVGGGLIATFEKIIEKAGKIADLGQKFGVLPESLQEIANAAEPNGAAMEDVASAMNKTVISQEKVRKGNKELRQTLKDLKIDTEAFINASPEEAFYMIADAVKGADDRTAAYGGVVELMGKKAGVLFTTLEQGSQAIKDQGRAVGVMSNDSVAKLDELGDTFTNVKNTLMAWGAEALSFVVKVTQSAGAIVGGIVYRLTGMFGTIGEAMKAAFAGDFQKAGEKLKEFGKDMIFQGDETKTAVSATKDELSEIWNPKKKDEEKPKTKRGLEELEEEKTMREKLADLYQKLEDKKRDLQNKALEGEAKINDLIEQRNKLYENAAAETDAVKQAEIWSKALDAEKEIMQEREKADKEAEQRADRIAKKKESLADKQFQNELEGMSEVERKAALQKKKDELTKKAAAEGDEEKRLDILTDIEDVNKQLKPKKEREVVASTLGRIGGGGGAYATPKNTIEERTARAAEDSARQLRENTTVLKQVRDKITPASWNP